MTKKRVEAIIRQLKEYESLERVGKKFHAWETIIYAGHISNKYLGIVEYIKKNDSIMNPFIVKNEKGEHVYAGTIDFFTDINKEPFSWLK
jgi:hypothetical protein